MVKRLGLVDTGLWYMDDEYNTQRGKTIAVIHAIHETSFCDFIVA
jgi:hypothetical protein